MRIINMRAVLAVIAVAGAMIVSGCAHRDHHHRHNPPPPPPHAPHGHDVHHKHGQPPPPPPADVKQHHHR